MKKIQTFHALNAHAKSMNLSQGLVEYFSTGKINDQIEKLFLNIGYWESLPQNPLQSDYDLLLKDLHFSEGRKLEHDLLKNGIRCIRIKSFSFPKLTFQRSRGRRLNDIDLWIEDPNDFKKAILLAKNNSYKKYPQNRWEAANNRINVYKSLPYCNIYVDIHNNLSWNLNSEFRWEVVSTDQQFYRLEDSHLILHLLINWIYQDGFVGPEKLIDIYFLLKNSLTIDTEKIVHLSKKLEIEHTVDLGLSLLKLFKISQIDHYQPTQKSVDLSKKIFDLDFIFNPYRNVMLFVYLKHYVRTSISQALYYDYLRLTSFLRSKNLESVDLN